MLPKIDVPLYELKLPLSKKKIKFRPFLVKEEKILLMAMESSDDKEVMLAIKQIINNCCASKIDIEKLPILDLEFLFLNLRARSVGEMIEMEYKCNNDIEKGGESHKCNNIVKVDFNALEVEPFFPKEHTNKIQLTENLGVVMKYPEFKLVESALDSTDEEIVTKTIISCIDYVYDKDEIFHMKDVDEKEALDFIDSLNREQFNKMQTFLETIPRLQKQVTFECKKCGYKEDLVLEGIQSFFG